MSKTKSRLRERFAAVDVVGKRETIMSEIRKKYDQPNNLTVTPIEHKNIMLIGRTRTGKSTLKSLLVDPTRVAEEMTLKAGTRDAVFEAFHMQEKNIVLNIIDTPGLFEHGTSEIDIRDNETILRLISECVNREITKFHAICFCVAITTGINEEDIRSLQELAKFLGPNISRNSCLIVTRCESKNDDQRRKIASELQSDSHFKELATFFKLGIFFSGALNRDDYNRGSESLYQQYFTATDYRHELIELFTGDIEPIPICDMLISDNLRLLKEDTEKSFELEYLRQEAKEQKVLIERLKDGWSDERQELDELIKKSRIDLQPDLK